MSDPLHKGSVRACGHSGLSGEDLADSFGKAHPLQFLFDGKVLVFDLGNRRPLGLRAAHVEQEGEEGVIPATFCIRESRASDFPDHVRH